METIKLDLIPGKKMPSLHASQYDDGREHGIDLFENGVAYNLDGTETLTINERKGDDCICSLDIENTFAETNHIVFASTEQMCAVWGNNICELVIAKGEKTIGTLNFILEIEQSPTEGGIESESEIKNLERQIEAITEEVIGENYYTKTQTDEAIADATEGKADTTYVDEQLELKADKDTTYTKTEVDTLIDNLPAPMIFKGTLGVGGTIQSLPTASASNEGWTYKVITDGTYAGQTAKVGDVFTSNGSAWVLIPSGDEENDTWRAIKVEGVEVLGNGISSGAVDFVGSENIEVEFDGNGNKVGVKTKNIYTKKEVDDIVYNILPDDTASGSVANFETDLALPIKSLEVDVNAVQESGTPTPDAPLPISGWSDISLHHLGENVFDAITWATLDRNPNFYSVSSDQEITVLANDGSGISQRLIDVIPNATYSYMSTFASSIRVFDSTGNTISNRTSDTFTAPANGKIAIKFYASTYPTTGKFILAYGSSIPTTWSAYNGNTEVIELGGTYYGGHFTQDKDGHRQFEVTSKFATFTGANNESWNDYPSGNGFFINLINDHITESYGDGKCNILPISKSFSTLGIVFGINSKYIFLMQVKNSWNISTVNELRDFLSVNNLQVVYTLAEPIIIDLPDGEPIITLNGTNNIFADTGDTSVVFKDSINGYVEKKIASVQALALNT